MTESHPSRVNFVLVPRRVEEVVAFLKREAPDFASSPEYEGLGTGTDGLPGVVAAAFARFVERVAGSTSIDAGFLQHLAILSLLADWKDSDVDEFLLDEVFEALSPEFAVIIRPMMGLRLRELHDEYRSRLDRHNRSNSLQ